jgi:hypothetical protein
VSSLNELIKRNKKE